MSSFFLRVWPFLSISAGAHVADATSSARYLSTIYFSIHAMPCDVGPSSHSLPTVGPTERDEESLVRIPGLISDTDRILGFGFMVDGEGFWVYFVSGLVWVVMRGR